MKIDTSSKDVIDEKITLEMCCSLANSNVAAGSELILCLQVNDIEFQQLEAVLQRLQSSSHVSRAETHFGQGESDQQSGQPSMSDEKVFSDIEKQSTNLTTSEPSDHQ